MKRIIRAALVLLCAALILSTISSCSKSKPSGIYVEEGTEYPFSCRLEGSTLVWSFCGEEECRNVYSLRYQKAGSDYYPGLYRIVTDGMPFPDPCDDMLFWDRDNDLLIFSFFSTDGVTHEARLMPAREG
ncbi:MAG: hypothetical protein IKQ92_09715 [Clostridia bacterium]|nr:hypothetical protein [Clostridia bacterium]